MSDAVSKLLDEIEAAVVKRERIIARSCGVGIAKPPLAARVATKAIDYAKRAILGREAAKISIALKSLEEFNRGSSEIIDDAQS